MTTNHIPLCHICTLCEHLQLSSLLCTKKYSFFNVCHHFAYNSISLVRQPFPTSTARTAVLLYNWRVTTDQQSWVTIPLFLWKCGDIQYTEAAALYIKHLPTCTISLCSQGKAFRLWKAYCHSGGEITFMFWRPVLPTVAMWVTLDLPQRERWHLSNLSCSPDRMQGVNSHQELFRYTVCRC